MRVLAVTGNASLVVALGSMMRDWEVVTVRGINEVAESGGDAVVALIDLGDTDQGIEVADQLYGRGITIPCVVIGDVTADHPRASVLVRPFSLEDLGGAVRSASERGSAPEPAPPRTQVPERAPESRETRVSNGRGDRPAARSTAAATASATTPAPRLDPEERAAQGRRGGLTVVRPEPEKTEPEKTEPATDDAPAVEEMPEIAEEPIPEPAAGEPAPPPPAAPPPPPAPQTDAPPSVVEPTTTIETPVAPDVRLPQPAVASPAAAAEAQPSTFAAPTRTEEAEPHARRRLRRRPQRAPQPEISAEAPVMRRLKAAAAFAPELEQLLEELPVLNDLREMADALAGELEAQFGAQVASVFVRGEGGFHSVAHRGLSRVEAGMVVLETQPLFSDVLRTREGILIQPVDLAQGLVAGIGGSRTEAMMACPAVFQGEIVAVVVVGGDRFADTDLDSLSDLATEAAPGLAVAHLLQRLRGWGSAE